MRRRKFCGILAVGASAVAGTALSPLVTGRRTSGGRQPVTRAHALPPVRAEPVPVVYYPGLEDLVDRAEARELLQRLVPSWYALKTTLVMHALRLWGPDATFPPERFLRPFDGRVFSGRELLQYLTDYEFYHKVAPGDLPLLVETRYGITSRTYATVRQGSFAGQLGHADDLLCTFSEIGVPSGAEIRTATRVAQVSYMLCDSIARFNYTQELEWTVEALARYLSPARNWTTAAAQTASFDASAGYLLERPLGKGACLGTHVPYALACLLGVSRQTNLLRSETEHRVIERLREVSLLLGHSSGAGGCWGANWADSMSTTSARAGLARVDDDITATGHHIEWLAQVPADIRPRRNRVRAAIEGALSLSRELTVYEVSRLYLPLSHLARALCLALGQRPMEIVGSGTRSRVDAVQKPPEQGSHSGP